MTHHGARCLLALFAAATPALASDAVIRAIVVSGDPAPGLSTVFFDAVSDPRINNAGQVLFWARLRGGNTTTSNDGSLWTDRSGSLALLLRESDPSPTGPGDFLTGLPTASFNDLDAIAVGASFLLPGGGNQTTRLAALREDPIGAFLARASDAVNTYNLPAFIPLASDGQGAVWNSASRDNSILSLTNPAADLTNATPVPAAIGIPPGATFRQFSYPGFSTTGKLAFRAAVGTSNVTNEWKYGFFTDRSGPLAAIAVTAAQVQGAPDGQTFVEISNTPEINQDGTIAYWARVAGAGAPAGSDTAIFRDSTPGALVAVAQAGNPAPGTTLTAFSGFSRRLGLSEDGRIAFIGYLLGGGAPRDANSGIWISDPGQPLRLLAREGDLVPSVAHARFSGFGDVRVGPGGQVAFTATLSGVSQNSAYALFATDLTGVIRVIAQTGEGFDIPGVDYRVVSQIIFDHDAAGFAQMNGNSTLAFKVTFTDGSMGLFLADLPCFGDFNHDGGIDASDVTEFMSAWELGDPSADVTRDSSVDGSDVEAFFTRWEAGTC